jgi:chromosome segregation ATPase
MSWLKPKPGVDIRFTLQGQRLNARVPAAVAAAFEGMRADIAELLEERGRLLHRITDLKTTIDALNTTVADLNTEAEQTLLSTTAMRETAKREHERQQKRIHALDEENKALRQAAVNAEKKLALAQAEVKKLDGEAVQLAAELLEATGRLHDAEERLASYGRVTS